MWNTGTMRINPQKFKSLAFTTTCATTHTTAQATASSIGIRPWQQNSVHLQPSSINTIIRILAVISYFTARAVRLAEESSKLLILAPHNDTIDDLEGKLGAPAPNYPPTLFDFYLVCILPPLLPPHQLRQVPVYQLTR